MAQIELTVPDLGGFSDIPVIEVLVAPGESVAKDAPLVTLESDKATMEVPASAAGVVKDVKVKVGDKVSQGSVLATVESAEPAAAAAVAPAAAAAPAAPVAPRNPGADRCGAGTERRARGQSSSCPTSATSKTCR